MPGTFAAGDLDIFETVKGSDGKKIGVINQLVEDQSASPGSPESFYMEVDCGGFLGIGTTRIFIPIGVVANARPGHGVVLLCTAQEAGEKYAHRLGKNDRGT